MVYGRSLQARTLMFIAFACLSLLVLTITQRITTRDAEIVQAQTETRNLARSLAQHANDVFQTADSILVGLRDVLGGEVTQQSLDQLHDVMKSRVENFKLLYNLFFFDASGKLIMSSMNKFAVNTSYEDRSYFQQLKNSPSDRLVIVGPLQSRTDGTWIIVVSRRMTDRDGRFLGVLSATISTDFFQQFYDTFNVGAKGAIVLYDVKGRLLVRKPYDALNIGIDRSSSTIFQPPFRNMRVGSFLSQQTIDGVERIGSFYYLDDYPFVSLVALEKSEVLESWFYATITQSIIVFATICLFIGFGHRLYRQLKERQRVEALYRLVADHSSDAIVCTGVDGCFRYISPSFTVMTGWSQADILLQPWTDNVHPEDTATVKTALEKLRSGAEQATCTYRYVCKNNSFLWVEARIRSVKTDRDLPEFVGNIRDISRSREAEERLAALNQTLTALSLTDGLTGLANRRHFDAVLAREWSVGGGMLSLLLLDVDHFKAYNDHYGHLLGDEILKSIAACINASLRPVDTATRYGGEEFAVILPTTGRDTAYQVAENIRRSVESQRIPHKGSNTGFITISIGISSTPPIPNQSPSILINQADAALYRAKVDRNQTQMSDHSV